MRLGKTNLEVNKNGFGALPIQRRNMDDSVEILLHAYENGIDFYDTAHFYTDSEEKMGNAFNNKLQEAMSSMINNQPQPVQPIIKKQKNKEKHDK